MKKAIAIVLCLVLAMAITLPAAALTSVPVKGISLNSTAVSLDVGKTYILKATLTPANTTQKALTYATSDKNVATVDAKGTIKAVGKGTATITVLTANKAVSAKCSVTVAGASAKPVTLTIAHLWGGTDPKAAVYQAAFKQFQKDNPNVTLKVDELPSSGYTDKENTWAATGEVPNIVLSDVGQQAKKFVDAGVAMDLTPFLNADKAWKDSFVPGIFDTGDAKFNGKIYFIPNEYYNFPLWNDKVVMQKVGISAPPVTWQEFMNDMILAKNKGFYGLYLPNKGQNFGPTLFAIIAGASGQTTIDAWNKALKGTGRFSDPLIIEVFKKYQALAPYVTPDANANDGTIADQDYYNHKYLFMFRGPWQIQKCNTRSPEGAAFETKLIFSSVPYIALSSKGFTPTGVGMQWMLSAKLSKDQTDAAVKLLKYITSPEVTLNYLYTAKESNGIKTENVDSAKVGPGLTQCFNLLNSLPNLKSPPSAYASYPTTDASNQSYIVSQLLIDNKITPAEAAEQLDDASASVN